MRVKRVTAASFLGLAFLLGASTGTAAGLPAEVTPADGASGDHFGYSVSVSGNTLLVGAPGSSVNGVLSGAAYIFTRVNGSWQLQAKLTPSDATSQVSFGQAVSLSGDTAVVGAPYAAVAGTPAGSAYVFTRSGSSWTQQARLSASDYTAYDYFGSSLSLSGDRVVIGAPFVDVFQADSGAAYVFTRSGGNWNSGVKVFPIDGRTTDYFGSSVALNGAELAVGAPNDDDNAVASGSVYVFSLSGATWLQTQKLRPNDGQNGDLFGNAVALSGTDLLVGAPDNDALGIAAGAAYQFSRSSGLWSFAQKLTANDAATGDFFGAAVALSGERAFVGAFLDDGAGIDTGSTYLFARSAGSFNQVRKDTLSAASESDNFGAAVAIDGLNAVAGADQANSNGVDAGSVLYINLDPNSIASVPALGTFAALLAQGGMLMFIGLRNRVVARRTRKNR
jgi:hypothetical protein